MVKSTLLWLCLIPFLTLLWWYWADRHQRLLKASRLTKGFLTFSMLLFFIGYLWVTLGRRNLIVTTPPPALLAFVLLWGMIFLPFLAMPSVTGLAILEIFGYFFKNNRRAQSTIIDPHQWSRRKWLGSMFTLIPVFGTYGTALFGMRQMKHFRVLEKTLRISDLPHALSGLRIAHLSDIHVGKFTNSHVLDEIAVVTNKLDADLILFTGDLVDYSLSSLPEAIEMMQKLRAKSGVYLVEGNHDVMESSLTFEKEVRAAGLNLLRNEVAHLRIRGAALDILGVVWRYGQPHMATDVAKVAALRDPNAFPILLSHHPHAFDDAVNHGLPLTLSGHTHGGQLMLTPDIGVGPVVFRYWAGLYQKAGHSLWITNGVGNWFPIRVNAPAEIVHLTLQRA
jgi:uncharacterized protein